MGETTSIKTVEAINQIEMIKTLIEFNKKGYFIVEVKQIIKPFGPCNDISVVFEITYDDEGWPFL